MQESANEESKPTLCATDKTCDQAKECKEWRPKNQLPYEFCNDFVCVPLWAACANESYWVPLVRRRNASRYFNNYCVGIYSCRNGRWEFELDETGNDSFWIKEENNFVCNQESDDGNTCEYYLFADSEEQVAAIVFVRSKEDDDIEMLWSEFETEELYPRLTILSHIKSHAPQSWQQPDARLYKYSCKSRESLQQKCKEWVRKGPLCETLRQLKDCDIYFLTKSMNQKEKIVAFAAGKYHNTDRIDKHWKAHVLYSNQTFDMAHRLLWTIEQHNKIPSFPLSIEQETSYWETYGANLVDSAIKCAGWDFKEFLEIEVEGFLCVLDNFLLFFFLIGGGQAKQTTRKVNLFQDPTKAAFHCLAKSHKSGAFVGLTNHAVCQCQHGSFLQDFGCLQPRLIAFQDDLSRAALKSRHTLGFHVHLPAYHP